MKTSTVPIPSEVTVAVPEQCREILAHLRLSKGLDPEKAASLMIYFACRLLEECPPQKDAELLADLDFAKGMRSRTVRRADEILGHAEKVLLESQGLHRGLRNRSLSNPSKS